MMSVPRDTALSVAAMAQLKAQFGARLQLDVPLARYTAARIGGPAQALIRVDTVENLIETIQYLWKITCPFFILGGGANILVSDAGYPGVVVLNRAKEIKLEVEKPAVWAASGTNFGQLSRMVSKRGLAGLEWAAGIPGTVGGAVFGNAGAHGGEIAHDLALVEILHQSGQRLVWTAEKMAFQYRSSILKRQKSPAVILAATFRLGQSTPENTHKKLESFGQIRQKTQPPGASMGSMFMNPPGDYAGRLIETAGLKGTRIGNAEISPVHANFFINHGETRASDIYALIRLAQEQVLQQFGVQLQLEIELIGRF